MIHKELTHVNVVKMHHYFEDNLNVYMLLEACPRKVSHVARTYIPLPVYYSSRHTRARSSSHSSVREKFRNSTYFHIHFYVYVRRLAASQVDPCELESASTALNGH